ncbi:hypothetical protein Leryth_014286 [Lithospermum erythrorhizon]|nr:hypothetical protein Leryth_014286 [Lithospermum erythrorhizon]
MEVDLVEHDLSEDDNYSIDEYNEDDLNFEGERCGICMDVVIDRGVLDCCQHWFCFTCIDNWATITNLCPLCQNEFQIITCVPVYDTISSTKTDEDTHPSDDSWSVDGRNSFPSYYIDENFYIKHSNFRGHVVVVLSRRNYLWLNPPAHCQQQMEEIGYFYHPSKWTPHKT